MKALHVTDVASPPALAWLEVPEPDPGPGQLVLSVRAVGLAWSDLLMAEGAYGLGGLKPPYTPGFEFVGAVVSCGPQTISPPRGTRMFGFLPYGGAFAERVLVPAAQFSEVPGQVSDEAAAAFVTSFLTADAALCTVGHLQRGETVVVQAAAGGLGGAAVQLCRLYGAGTVIGTAGSAERREYVRSIGADVAVHYSEVEEAVRDVTGGRGADLVLESVGGDAFDQSVACLHQLGRLVTLGASSGQRPSSLRLSVLWSRGISVAGLHLTRWMEDMPELLDPSRSRTLEALARGKITPAVGATFSIKNVADAFQALHGRVVNGKVVVVFDDDPTDPIDPVSQ